LDGRQQQRDQHCNNGDDYEQLDQREAWSNPLTRWNWHGFAPRKSAPQAPWLRGT
jgi:hypothetical protein